MFGEPLDLAGDPKAGDKIAALAALSEAHHSLKISLIVIDTLTLCFGGGEENSARDAGCAVASAKVVAEKTSAHVMLVHHTGRIARPVREAPILLPATATR